MTPEARMTVHDISTTDRAESSIDIALELVDAVRRWDRQDVRHVIRTADLPALCVVLAAMVDESSTLTDLLGWTADRDAQFDGWTREQLLQAHAQYQLCRSRGVEPSPDVREGQRVYDRVRKRVARQTDPSLFQGSRPRPSDHRESA